MSNALIETVEKIKAEKMDEIGEALDDFRWKAAKKREESLAGHILAGLCANPHITAQDLTCAELVDRACDQANALLYFFDEVWEWTGE